MKVFLDTNALISFFAFEGVTRDLVTLLFEKHEVSVSPQVLEEFRRVLVSRLKANPAKVDAFLDGIPNIAAIIQPPYSHRMDVRDPNDIEILAAALKSKAEYLVTGDKDLLTVDTKGAIRIVKPRELFDFLEGII